MADGIGGIPLANGLATSQGSATPAAAPTIELAQSPPAALLAASTLAAVVLGRGGNGALLLRTDYGTLALKTTLALAVDSKVDLRLLPGPPPAVVLLHIEQPPGAARTASPLPGAPATPPSPATSTRPAAAPNGSATAPAMADEPPAQFDLGTEIEATLITPPAAPDAATMTVGTRLVLRITLPPTATSAAPLSPSVPMPNAAPAAPRPLGPAALPLPLVAGPGAGAAFAGLGLPSPPGPVPPTLAAPAPFPAVPGAAAANTGGTVTGAGPQPAANFAFTGQVVPAQPDFGDRTLLATPIGTLALDRRIALPPGTAVSVLRLAATPPAATVPAIGHATVLQATVVAPPSNASQEALPTGTRLVLRVAAAPAAAAAVALPAADEATTTGTVIAANSGETMLATPFGTLALDRRLTLPPGALLQLQRLGTTLPAAPADASPAQGTSWPALDQALSVLDRVAPDLAATLRSDLAPTTGPQLAGTLLFLMDALTGGGWPGGRVTAALSAAGRRDLSLRLDRDIGEIRRLADPPSGDWRVFVLPVLDEASVRPVRLYLRQRSGSERGDKEGSRFVLDVDTSRLGALQIDGLVRQRRFDVALRSHKPLAAEMRQDIAALFHNSISASGLSGDIIFTTASRFAVAPLDALRTPVGIDA
jgi:hypothetical protein